MIRRFRLVAMAAAALLMVSSGAALAADDADSDDGDDDREDTVFTFGYDADNHVLVTGLSAAGSVYDCTLSGAFTLSYGETTDRLRPVDAVEGVEGPAEFAPRDAADLDEGLTPALAPIAYDAPDNPCQLTGLIVAGPQGQVNHGQVVSAFSHALKGSAKGCVMRYIAGSDFGKGADQVKTGDVGETVEVAASGTIDLETVLADCDKGKSNKDKDAAKDKADKDAAKGKPESPGKSGDAPGQNK